MPLRHSAARFFSICLLGAVALISQLGAPLSFTEPLRIGLNSAPKTLNPLLAADAGGARILQLTHPALLRWDVRLMPQGQVAEGCQQVSTTEIHCALPNAQVFTSGVPLTSQAVAAWLRQIQANPRSPLAGSWRGVSMSTPTPTKLVLQLPSPTLSFFSTLVETPLADPAAPNFGMGPYVATQEEATGVVTLTPSPTANLRPLQFIPLSDATTRILKLQKGELDVLLHDLPPTLLRYAQAEAPKHGWEILAAPSSSYSYLTLNFRNPLLAEPSVREALSLALNRSLLRRALLNDLATPATSLLPPGHPAMWEAKEDVYDPLSAESLLEETQLPDGRTLMMGPENTRLSLTLLTSTEAFSQRLGQALQAQWAKVGVNVQLESAEWASFHSRVQQGQFDMALLTWTGLQQPSFYHKVFNSTQAPPNGFNRGAVNDAELDALTSQLVAATIPAQELALAKQVQQRVAAVRPYLPLWRRHHVMIMGPGVRGCTMGLAGDYQGLTTCYRDSRERGTR
jgi:peptide/nickel transport system substrate-binding protein